MELSVFLWPNLHIISHYTLYVLYHIIYFASTFSTFPLPLCSIISLRFVILSIITFLLSLSLETLNKFVSIGSPISDMLHHEGVKHGFLSCFFSLSFLSLLPLTYKWRKYYFWVKFSKRRFWWLYMFWGLSESKNYIFSVWSVCLYVCVSIILA